MISSNQKPLASIFFLLLVITIASRFYGIWLWDLVDDEYFTATLAYERYRSFVNPAYYSLVVLTYEIFGYDLWLSRLPGVILAVFSIPVFYLHASKVFGRNAALFSSLILVFSAWHLYFSQLARFYIGVFFFGSVAYIYFYRAIYSPNIRNLVLALVFSLVAVMFHATALFIPVSVAVSYTLIFIFFREKYSHVSMSNIKLFLIICLIVGLLVTPFFIGVLNRWVSTGQSWGYGWFLIVPQVIKYIQIPIVVSAFFGLLVIYLKDKVAAIYFISIILAPILFLMVGSVFMAVSPSYVFYIFVPVVILSGVACERVRRAASDKDYAVIGYVPLFLILAGLAPSFVSHFLAKNSLNFNSAEEFVERNIESGDQVLSFIPGFELSAKTDFHLLPFISFERDDSIDWEKRLGEMLNKDQRAWIVVSSKRRPLASNLEKWLFCNSKLVWQEHALRIDYEVDGYQIYMFENHSEKMKIIKTCKF